MSIDATIDVANRDEEVRIDLRPWISAATTVVVNGTITFDGLSNKSNIHVYGKG